MSQSWDPEYCDCAHMGRPGRLLRKQKVPAAPQKCPSPVYFYSTSEVKLVSRRSGTHTNVINKPINLQMGDSLVLRQ